MNSTRQVVLSAQQLASLAQFRFSAPVTVRGALPVEHGTPATLMVIDSTQRVFFLLADGSSSKDGA